MHAPPRPAPAPAPGKMSAPARPCPENFQDCPAPPRTVPQNWGPGGHFRLQPFSGIWQTKNLQLG